MHVDTSLEAAVLGWVATRSPRRANDRPGVPLIEVLAADLGLDPDPATLDALAATLTSLEAQERVVLDGPVETAADLAPLDLSAAAAPEPAGPSDGRPPHITTYSQLDEAARHVQLNWALRALRDQTDPATGVGTLDLRQTVTELGLNPKDVRHDLEGLGLLRKASGGEAIGESWWVDPEQTVTVAALEEAERSDLPEADAVPAEITPDPAPVQARPLPADLGPLMESLARLEPRLVELVSQLVEAAESLHAMAGSQAHLLRELTSEIEALRKERDRMLRDASSLRQEIWTLKRTSTRNEGAEELTAEAARLRAAERRFAGTAGEVTDKVRRVQRSLEEVVDGED